MHSLVTYWSAPSFCVHKPHTLNIVGARMSKPHTSVAALRMCVCLLACLRPYTVNFKLAHINFNITKIELDGWSVGLGGLCSIFHPLCYSNMLEIIPIMLETMPQICLLCSNYAHNFWKEQMLFVFRNLNRPRAKPLSITWASWGFIVGRRPPQAAGPAPGMHGPS